LPYCSVFKINKNENLTARCLREIVKLRYNVPTAPGLRIGARLLAQGSLFGGTEGDVVGGRGAGSPVTAVNGPSYVQMVEIFKVAIEAK
jgi:hypothetical protein